MKIAFWSHLRHSGGVTTNLASMAAMSAVSGSGRSVLLENHYNKNNLGSILTIQESLECLRERQYYNRYGIEYLLKRLYTGEPGEVLLRRTAIPLLYSSIFYVPQSYIVNREVFNYEFQLVRKQLFECLEGFCELVLVDTEANENLSSVAILEDVDLIVVNLDQNPDSWAEFMENYSLLKEKCIFLIGRYRGEGKWNLSRIRREFSIPAGDIGVIPYNMELELYLGEGRLLQFINRNYHRASTRENDLFLREVRKSFLMFRNHYMMLRRERQRRSFPYASCIEDRN